MARHDSDSEDDRKTEKKRDRSRSPPPRRRSPSPRRRRDDRDRRRRSPEERRRSPDRRDRSRYDEDRVKREPESPERGDREQRRSPERRERKRYDDDRVKREPNSPDRERRNGHDRRERDDRREKKQRWGRQEDWDDKRGDDEKKEDEVPQEKEKVNLGTSGILAADTNTFKGVVIKYNEPPEAKKPVVRWRLYPFKGEEALPALYVHRQSAYLIGRDRKVADLPIDHPSSSKQHAVLQYRSVGFEREDGTRGRHTLPYIIDLASANGTFLNGKKLEPSRYYELQEKDVIKFGFSSREYVILSEKATDNYSDQEPVSDRSE